MRRWTRAFVVAALLLSGPALAQEPTVKELFENGQLHFDGGHYELAIEAWAEAHRRSERPILLVKLADAHEALGAFANAVEVLEQYRDQAETSEVEAVEARIRKLQEQTASPEPPPPKAPEEPIPDPEPEPEPIKRSVLVEGTLIGVTFGGLGLGTGYGLRARAARKQAAESCVDGSKGLVCTDGAEQSLSRDKGASMTADVSFALGGAAAVTFGIYELLVMGSSDVAVVPTSNGVAVQWTIR